MKDSIVIISDEYPSMEEKVVQGGAGVHLRQVATALQNRFDVHVMTSGQKHRTVTTLKSGKIQVDEIGTHFYKTSIKYRLLGNIISGTCIILRLIRLRDVLLWNINCFAYFAALPDKKRPQYALTTEFNASGLFLFFFQDISRMILCVGWTDLLWKSPTRRFLSPDNQIVASLERLTARRATTVFTTSQLMIQHVAAWTKRKDIHVLDKSTQFQFDQKKLVGTQSQKEFVVSFFGRFDYRKGPDILLKAGQLLDTPKIHVQFFGHDAVDAYPEYSTQALLFSKLAKEVSKHTATHITVSSSLPYSKTHEEMLRSHLIVVPSRFEPLSLVVLEALAHGRVVITTTQTGAGEVVTHEHDGIIIAPDAQELATRIGRLLDMPEQERKRIEKQALLTSKTLPLKNIQTSFISHL